MVRIGFVTDLHYREAVPGDSPNPQRELRRVGALFRRCLQRFRNAGVELVLVAGENVDAPLADPRLDADLVSLREMLTGSGIPFVIIPGNHDPAPEVFYRVLPQPPPGAPQWQLRDHHVRRRYVRSRDAVRFPPALSC